MDNVLLLASNDYSNLFVVCLGLGTVFAGLIAIIIICKLIGLFCNIGNKQKPDTSITTNSEPVKTTEKVEIPNRRETVAAIAAAVAEDLGTDVSAIRILSIEKINS